MFKLKVLDLECSNTIMVGGEQDLIKRNLALTQDEMKKDVDPATTLGSATPVLTKCESLRCTYHSIINLN